MGPPGRGGRCRGGNGHPCGDRGLRPPEARAANPEQRGEKTLNWAQLANALVKLLEVAPVLAPQVKELWNSVHSHQPAPDDVHAKVLDAVKEAAHR